MSRLPLRLIAATLFAGASISMAAPAWAAVPAPSQPGNRGCAANGALISSAAKDPGPNTGNWDVAPGRPNNPGQSIVSAGKTGPCH